MMDDSTQRTSSKLPECFSRYCGEHSQELEHSDSFSLSCGEQSGRCSFTPDISHILTLAGLHVVRNDKNEVTGTRSTRDGAQSIGYQHGKEAVRALSQASLFTHRCDDTHDCVHYECSEL